MPHLVLGLHFLALAVGAGSLAQALMIWLRHRKAVIRHYALFLLSTWLILLALAVERYGRNAGLAGDGSLAAVVWILQAAGGLLYIAASPFFYYSLMGLRMPRWSLGLYLGIDAVAFGAAVAYVAAPGTIWVGIVLNSLLFGMIGLGLVLVAFSLGRTADPVLRKALLVFLVHNSLSIAFGLRYLNRPAYAEAGRPTTFFLERFGITEREAAVIGLLLEGASGKDIADRLYISAKTVENHVTNIYRKVGARNRVQLFRLIRANALEEPGA